MPTMRGGGEGSGVNTVCPHCKCTGRIEVCVVNTVDDLKTRLSQRAGDGPRAVYRAEIGGFYIDYRGGRVADVVVDAALRDGIIVPYWEDSPGVEMWKLHQERGLA